MLSTATAKVALRSPRWQVSIGPQYHHDHSTGDPCALAQGRFPAVLAVEVPVRWRPAANWRGAACADPTHERWQSAVGGTPRMHGELLKLGFEASILLIVLPTGVIGGVSIPSLL